MLPALGPLAPQHQLQQERARREPDLGAPWRNLRTANTPSLFRSHAAAKKS
jgi:hypothetical protein